jgi:hypothetical protein
MRIKKSSPSTRHGGAWGERRYSSYSFTTSAVNGGEWSASRPGRALPPGKVPPVPIVQEAGWAPEPVWTMRWGYKKYICNLRREIYWKSFTLNTNNELGAWAPTTWVPWTLDTHWRISGVAEFSLKAPYLHF